MLYLGEIAGEKIQPRGRLGAALDQKVSCLQQSGVLSLPHFHILVFLSSGLKEIIGQEKNMCIAHLAPRTTYIPPKSHQE